MTPDVPLAPLCTLGTGGRAAWLERVTDEDTLAGLVRSATQPLYVLGGGSNVVISDTGLAGVVAHIAIGGIERRRLADDFIYTVGAGVDWDTFVAQSLEDGAAGLETLSGIPGTIGATPIQNVGAYGREIGELLLRVRAYDREARAFVWLDKASLGLGYRTSVLKGGERFIVSAVELRLPASADGLPITYAELGRALGALPGAPRVPAARVRETVLALRRAKGMVIDADDPESRSVGSFFTNPIVDAERAALLPPEVPRYPQADGRIKLAAAWLVEHAGLERGHTLGRARISRKHALALVNGGGASSEDILALARVVRDAVNQTFGIALVPEPVLLGCRW